MTTALAITALVSAACWLSTFRDLRAAESRAAYQMTVRHRVEADLIEAIVARDAARKRLRALEEAVDAGRLALGVERESYSDFRLRTAAEAAEGAQWTRHA